MRLPSERIRLVLWALLLFAVALLLNQRHHHFPFYYHPDEPGKAEQVLSGRWNFNHPMLLLAATHLATDLLRVPRDEQAVVEAGRLVSSLFTAAAIVALSLTAYLWRGWLAALLAGAGLTLHHQLYELSHYMKEDTALLMGLAFTFLTCVAYAQRGSAWRAFLIGIATALALSGKYLGAVALALVLPVLWLQSRGHRPERFGLFLLGFVAVLALVNFPLVVDIIAPAGHGVFEKSLSREVGLVVHGQGDVTRRIPHALYWNVFLDNSTPAIWVLLLSFAAAWSHRRSIRPIAERLVAAFPFALALALSFSPKENDRYFLPATAVFTLLAALGVQDLPNFVAWLLSLCGAQHPERLFTERGRKIVIGFGAAVFLVLQFTGWSSTKPGWWRYDQAFTRDDIADLIRWLRTTREVPATATMVADARTGLRDPARKKQVPAEYPPQTVIVRKQASDVGTLDELRARKIDFVAVSESTYGRYSRDNLKPKDASDPRYNKAKSFYEELLRSGVPLFERDRGTVIYLHPGIRVYRLVRWEGE